MTPSREQLYEALYALLCTLPGLTTTGRRPVQYSKLTKEQLPALFIGAGPQMPHNDKSGLPVYWELKGTIYLVCWSSDPAIAPSQILNPMLDWIELTLAPPGSGNSWPSGFCTLNGLAHHVWLEEEITTSGDTLDNYGVALIPFCILTNPT
jgi:hypothetical protein